MNSMKTMICLVACCLGYFALSLGAELPSRGICAHRGASATFPENTLPAFREAARLGAQMIEFDVYLTRDGQPVIMHDPMVNRTTDGEGKIADLTLEEIKRLDAGAWKGAAFKGLRVPTLAEALDVMPRGVWMNVHMKQGAALGKVVAETLQQKGRADQCVLACSVEAIEAVRKTLPHVKWCFMERQYGQMDQYAEGAIHAKADFIQLVGTPPQNMAERIGNLKQHGIRVNYFGIEDADGLRKLLKAGVDFPLVNDVAAAFKVAADYGIKPL